MTIKQLNRFTRLEKKTDVEAAYNSLVYRLDEWIEAVDCS